MKRIIITIFLVSANFLFAQEKNWEIIGVMENPIAVGKAVYQDGSIYISGGYSKDTQDNVAWIQEYDIVLGKSEIISNMRISRYGHESLIINGKLYFVGGVHDSTEINSSLEEWDVTASDTTRVVAADSNFNRIFSTGVSYDNLFYLIGGNSYSTRDTNVLSYIVEYDVTNDSILYKFNGDGYLNEFPEQQMSAIYGDDIYIFGGVLNGVLQSIQKFNISTHTLDTLDIKLLEPRAGGVTVRNVYTNEIYIIGGFNEGNTALRSVEIFTISDENYSINPGPELNEARTNLMAVSLTEDEIFVLGGYNVNGEVINSIENLRASVVSLNDTKTKPILYSLEQNYPNPFNPTTTIKYTIPFAKRDLSRSNESEQKATLQVTLKVYNILGSEIAILVDNEQSAGNYSVVFDANGLTSGVYFYKLQTGSFVETKKMTIIK